MSSTFTDPSTGQTTTITPGGIGAPAPVAGGGENQNILSYQGQYNMAWYAHQPTAKQPLYGGRSGPNSGNPLSVTAQWALIGQLIQQGYLIDEDIDGGNDPYATNYARQKAGQTWEPAGNGAVDVTSIDEPGAVVTPGEYSGTPPAGVRYNSVSLLISDWPPYVAPATPVTPSGAPLAPISMPIGGIVALQNPSTGLMYAGSIFKPLVNTQGMDGYVMGAYFSGTAQGLTGTWQKSPGFMGMGWQWTFLGVGSTVPAS